MLLLQSRSKFLQTSNQILCVIVSPLILGIKLQLNKDVLVTVSLHFNWVNVALHKYVMKVK